MNIARMFRSSVSPALLTAPLLLACGDDVTNYYSDPPTYTPDAIVTHDQLQAALTTALSSTNGGLDFPMWATVVDRAGVVVAVVVLVVVLVVTPVALVELLSVVYQAHRSVLQPDNNGRK